MLVYLQSVWSRVTDWFNHHYYSAISFLNYYSGRVIEVGYSWYWLIRDVVIEWRGIIYWLVYSAYWYIHWFVTFGYSILAQLVTYWFWQIVGFIQNSAPVLIGFLNSELPLIRNQLLGIIGNIVNVCYYWYGAIQRLVGFDINSIFALIDTFRNQLWYFFNNTLPNLWSSLDQIPGLIATLRNDVFSRLAFWLNNDTVRFVINLMNNPLQPIQLVIDVAILTPLSNLLTHLWYPHDPHEGE